VSRNVVGGPATATTLLKSSLGTSDVLNATTLLAMPADQQKNALGERLFASINEAYPDLAAKITGMLLEMDNLEILNLLVTPQMLQAKVGEALEVLKRHPDEMSAAAAGADE
jgi:polyadenylate-binding protein